MRKSIYTYIHVVFKTLEHW